jgi:hypothetical protein
MVYQPYSKEIMGGRNKSGLDATKVKLELWFNLLVFESPLIQRIDHHHHTEFIRQLSSRYMRNEPWLLS